MTETLHVAIAHVGCVGCFEYLVDPFDPLAATDADGDQLTYSARINLDNSVYGAIGLDGDQDWFAFKVKAGKTYHLYTELDAGIDLGGDEGRGEALVDSVMSLYGQDGSTLLDMDDDGGLGQASSIFWTAETDGTHYLAVSAADGVGRGSYRVHFDVRD